MAASLMIANGHLIFLMDLCGYVWVNILTLSPSREWGFFNRCAGIDVLGPNFVLCDSNRSSPSRDMKDRKTNNYITVWTHILVGNNITHVYILSAIKVSLLESFPPVDTMIGNGSCRDA